MPAPSPPAGAMCLLVSNFTPEKRSKRYPPGGGGFIAGAPFGGAETQPALQNLKCKIPTFWKLYAFRKMEVRRAGREEGASLVL